MKVKSLTKASVLC